MRYLSLAEQAEVLTGVVAERYPGMSADDRAQFASAVLYKVTDLLCHGGDVVLESYDADGHPHRPAATGSQD